MSTRILTFSLLTLFAFSASRGMANEPSKPTASATAQAASPETSERQSHEVEAEVVSADAEKKTLTFKTVAGESTSTVDAEALATLKDLKPGQTVTIVCRDDDKGAHEAVASITTKAAQ